MDRLEASRILGIDAATDAETARTAYRQLLHAVHPDRGGDAVMFDLVQEAWAAFRADESFQAPAPHETAGPGHRPAGERVKDVLGEFSLGCGTTVLFWVGVAVLAFLAAIVREIVTWPAAPKGRYPVGRAPPNAHAYLRGAMSPRCRTGRSPVGVPKRWPQRRR